VESLETRWEQFRGIEMSLRKANDTRLLDSLLQIRAFLLGKL